MSQGVWNVMYWKNYASDIWPLHYSVLCFIKQTYFEIEEVESESGELRVRSQSVAYSYIFPKTSEAEGDKFSTCLEK